MQRHTRLLRPERIAARYPRGGRAMLALFKQFQSSDTVAWFEARGVKLKTEGDGRMFPVSDSSQTIIDCLMNAARVANVKLRLNCGVERVTKLANGGFELKFPPAKVLPATNCCLPPAAVARRRAVARRLARPHTRTAGAVAVHVSHRDSVVERAGGSFRRDGRGVRAGKHDCTNAARFWSRIGA